MVIVDIKEGNNKEISLYFDGKLVRGLKKVKKRITKKDHDYVIAIDGEEGSGKSTFAFQIAKFIDPNFNSSRVCMTPLEFSQAIMKAKKGQSIVYDEAFTGLSSRGALSEINKLLVSLMMEMRQKNLFVIIVLPTFFLLDKYVALWRAKCLIHVYMKSSKRGYFIFFNRKKKKILYLRGKKDYSYSVIKTRFRGRFTGKCVIDEEEYKKRKAKALKSRDRRTRSDKYKAQRDKLLYVLYKEASLTMRELEDACKLYGVQLKKTVISDIIAKFRVRV